jgi:cobalt-zinc-cadmium efflux system protein
MTHDHHHQHAPGQPHTHGHSHVPANVSNLTMGIAVALTLVFVLVEAVCGLLAHSLALLSDAGHNLTDAAALGFSWYALWISNKPSHQGMTFGYHRVGVLAALCNAVSLLVIAVFIAWEAIARLRQPEAADGVLMIAVAASAVVVNLVIGVWLHRGAKTDLNIRSAYLHMLGDAVSAFGVVIAGVLVTTTGARWADPVVSLLIAGLILASSYGVLRESATVLLEGTPAGMDMPAVIAAIKAVAGVLEVHDLHVWMVGPGVVACSCHIVVAEQSILEGQQVLRAVVQDIHHRFHINHTTVQVEAEGCDANDMYCVGQRLRIPPETSGASATTLK